MTERALLVRMATSPAGRYFAVGIETPKVRVFDTLTGRLAAVVEPAPNSLLSRNNRKGTGLNPTMLTSIAFVARGGADGSDVAAAGASSAEDPAGFLVAVGCSDGTVLVHDLNSDRLLHHVAVSDTQQTVTSLAAAGPYLLASTAGNTLSVVDFATGAVALENIPIVRGCTAIDAALLPTTADGTLMIICCGAQSVLYRLHVASHSNGNKMEKLTTTSTHTQAVTDVTLSRTDPFVAVTTSAGEGTLRVWDLAPTNDRGDRCRRVLAAGGRVAHVSVWSEHNHSATTQQQKKQQQQQQARDPVVATVVATTFAGNTLVWRLRDLAPRTADVLPLRPTAAFTTQEAQGRLLACAASGVGTLVFVRGRYATPRFEGKTLATTVAIASAAKAGELAAERLPFLQATASAGLSTGAAADDDAFDPTDCWASHEAVSTLALATGSEEFAAPRVHRERDMKTLAKVAAPSSTKAAAVAGASVPLHQALHADDTSMVLELLHVAGATESSMAALVQSMQLPYLLKLLKILSDRVVTLGARHPLHKWIHVALRHRGAELFAHERAAKKAAAEAAQSPNAGVTDIAALPSTFLAPLMHHYRSLAELRDQLSHLHGRMSIFRAVNPHNTSASGTKQVAFPNEFMDLHADDAESWKIVRVKRTASGALESRRSRKRRNMLPDGGDRDVDDEAADDAPQRLLDELGDESGNDDDDEGEGERSDGGDDSDEEGDDEEGDDLSDLDDEDLENMDLDDDDDDDFDDDDDEGDGEGASGSGGNQQRRKDRRGAGADDYDDDEAREDPGIRRQQQQRRRRGGASADDDDDVDEIGADEEEELLGGDDADEAAALMAIDEDDRRGFSRVADAKKKKNARLRLD